MTAIEKHDTGKRGPQWNSNTSGPSRQSLAPCGTGIPTSPSGSNPSPTNGIRAAVSAGLIDVGFLLQPPLQATSSLAVKHLRTEPLLMVAGADHPLATPVEDVAEEFAPTTLFLTERGCGYRPLLEAHFDRAGVRPGHTLEFDNANPSRLNPARHPRS